MTATPPRDFVIINANIHSLDPALPRARAIAAKDGRIAAIGSNDVVLAYAGRELPQTAVSDLGGKTVLPGFIDAHTHFDLDVCNTTTADDFFSGSRAALRGGATDDEIAALFRQALQSKPSAHQLADHGSAFRKRGMSQIGG